MKPSVGESGIPAPSPKPRTGAATGTAVLATLLLMISMIGIGKLMSAEASQLRGTVASLSRVAIFDGAVLAIGSVAAFTYLATRRRWAWVVALVSWGISIASGILLAGLSWMEFFVRDPPRGDFAGLVAMFSFALSVALPILLALITSIAAVCLVRAPREIALESFFPICTRTDENTNPH